MLALRLGARRASGAVARTVVRCSLGGRTAVRSLGSDISADELTEVDQRLTDRLNHEIAEEESYEAPPELAELEASIEFEVDQDTMPTGSLLTTLVRSSEEEVVEVNFSVGDLVTPTPDDEVDEFDTDADEDDDDFSGFQAYVPFQVTVSKSSVDDAVLQFDCDATELGGIQVHRVRVERDTDADDDDMEMDDDDEVAALDLDVDPNQDGGTGRDRGDAVAAYDGPRFDDLDEELQEHFMEFLEARGVDAALAQYIVLSSQHREQVAYINWLCEVDDFVRADESED